MGRRGARCVSIVAALAVLSPAVAAAKPSRANVEVDASQAGDAGPIIQRRVEERGDVVLREAGVLPAETANDPVFHVLVVEEHGEEPGFRATIWAERRGAPVGEGRAIDCNLCTETEIVAKVETELERLLQGVHDEIPESLVPAPAGVPEAKVPATNEPAEVHAPAPSISPELALPPDDGARPLGAKGKAGIGLLVFGGAALVTGIVLAIPDWEPVPGNPLRERSTRPIGLGVLGGAAVLVAVGGALLGVDRRTPRGAPKFAVARTPMGGWMLAVEQRF